MKIKEINKIVICNLWYWDLDYAVEAGLKVAASAVGTTHVLAVVTPGTNCSRRTFFHKAQEAIYKKEKKNQRALMTQLIRALCHEMISVFIVYYSVN